MAISELRKLTGETYKLAPEAAEVTQKRPSKAPFVIVPVITVALIVCLVIQQAGYERQVEIAATAGIKDQVKRSVRQVTAARHQNLAMHKRMRAGGGGKTVAASAHWPAGPMSQVDEQLHLADQLALNGKFNDSAAALLNAVARYKKNVALREAAIRAEMRRRNFAGARKLCVDGMQLASNQDDQAALAGLLKFIPAK